MTSVAARLDALFAHLGLDRVFMATQMPGDIADFCATRPDRVAGLALIIASRLNPAAFAPLGERVMVLAGESGIPTDAADAAAPGMPDARQFRLAGYAATAWSDIAVERPDRLCDELAGFLGGLAPLPAFQSAETARRGAVAGITYRVIGAGPPLVLMPFFLAASQWEPVVSRLAERFTVIVLGGAHIGGVAMLEDRASLASYGDMLSALVNRMRIPNGAQVLEVGCGPAALCRQVLASRPDLTLTGLDANGYLLREGAALAEAAGLPVSGPGSSDTVPGTGGLHLVEGDATDLPFDDNSFDALYSITVLEECDAAAALAEMARVTRPGGSVGVVVRAIDMPQWWNLDLPPAIAAKVNAQPQSVSPGAVADRSLYSRMAAAGFHDIQGFPALLTFDRPEGPIWSYRASHARGLLDVGEQEIWDREVAAREAEGLLFQANPVHCAVGWSG